MNFGDVVTIDFGTPIGSQAGFPRRAIVVTADAFLRYRPSTVFAVPLISTPRRFPSHVEIDPDEGNGLTIRSWALVEQMRAVAIERCSAPMGNIGPTVGHQVLDVLAMIVGLP